MEEVEGNLGLVAPVALEVILADAYGLGDLLDRPQTGGASYLYIGKYVQSASRRYFPPKYSSGSPSLVPPETISPTKMSWSPPGRISRN